MHWPLEEAQGWGRPCCRCSQRGVWQSVSSWCSFPWAPRSRHVDPVGCSEAGWIPRCPQPPPEFGCSYPEADRVWHRRLSSSALLSVSPPLIMQLNSSTSKEDQDKVTWLWLSQGGQLNAAVSLTSSTVEIYLRQTRKLLEMNCNYPWIHTLTSPHLVTKIALLKYPTVILDLQLCLTKSLTEKQINS